MNRNHFALVFVFMAAIILLFLTLIPMDTAAQGEGQPNNTTSSSPAGTAFTYQGELTDGGEPANGSYNFRFYLWSDQTKTTLIATYPSLSTIPVSVTKGKFTVLIDFGSDVFNGEERWLEIEVNGTLLSPLQPLTPTPYAIHALNVPWSGISGVPEGLDDGDDDTTYSNGEGLFLSGTEFSVAFAGSGSASTAARSDHNHNGVYSTDPHDHLGETWSGTDNPLTISGSYATAPLVLENSNYDGAGLRVNGANGDGIFVYDAGNVMTHTTSYSHNGVEVAGAYGDGFLVGYAGRNGITVGEAAGLGSKVNYAGEDGYYVHQAGDVGTHTPSDDYNGFEVAGAEGNGLAVGWVEKDGVWVDYAGYSGMRVNSAVWEGVYVNHAGTDGFYVYEAGDVMTRTESTDFNGFEVAGAQGNGVYVGYADQDGIQVDEAGRYGILVRNAGDNGITVGGTSGDGVNVFSAGDATYTAVSGASNGFEVSGAEGNGLYVGYAGEYGVWVDDAADDGLFINNAGGDGVQISGAAENGILVANSGKDGVYVYKAGEVISPTVSTANNGFEVAGAQDHGLFVGYAGLTGLTIDEAGIVGLYVTKTGDDGLLIGQTGDDGVQIGYAEDDGVYVFDAGEVFTHTNNTGRNGFEVAGAQDTGFYAGYVGHNGFWVKEAGYNGVQVGAADQNGVYANTTQTSGEWGFHTYDKIYGSNLTSSSITLLAVVVGQEALEAGDVVAAVGVTDPLPGSTEYLPLVCLAVEGLFDGMIGVVQGRMAIVPQPAIEGEAEPLTNMRSAEGPAHQGDYVAIMVMGVAQVKIDPNADIQPGQRLTAASLAGTARPLRTESLNGMLVTEGAPVLGIALAAPIPGETTIPVFIALR